jgi:hypothetical protein
MDWDQAKNGDSTAAETRTESTSYEQPAAHSAVTMVSFGTVTLLSLAQRASLPDSALGIARDRRINAENQRIDRAFQEEWGCHSERAWTDAQAIWLSETTFPVDQCIRPALWLSRSQMIRFLATTIPALKKQRIKSFRVCTGRPRSSVSRPAYRDTNGREDTHSRAQY